MNEGQGSITYGGGSGLAAGAISFFGARDGVSLDTDGFVVLGNLTTDATEPAKLLDNRRIQQQGFVVEWAFDNNAAWNWTLNNQNGGGGNIIPTSWISPDSSNWSVWQPGNFGVDYAPFGIGGRFQSGYSLYPGVNDPTTDRPNMVGMFWGYNIDFTQGRIDLSEAGFRFATESFFVIGDDPNFEFHLPEIITSSGSIHRLDSTYVSRTTGRGFREIVIDELEIYDVTNDPAMGLFYWSTDYNISSDTTRMQVLSQNAGGVTQVLFGNRTDGSGTFTWQSGEFVIQGGSIFLLASTNRVVLDGANFNQSIGIMLAGDNVGDSPNEDAVLEAQSTTRGFRMTSLTTAQRLAIAAVGVGGLMTWDSDLGAFMIWDGALWRTVTIV